jgi:hypothetical protein
MDDPYATFEARLAPLARYADDAARVGLGLVILFAGVHKLLDPGAWAVYVDPTLAGLLPLSPVAFMLLNGVLELPFALALLLDRYTTGAAAFVTASLVATVGYLSAVALVGDGGAVDVIVRDVGLAALAAAVTLRGAAAEA